MTVTYTDEVATCGRFGSFLKLLFRWRGSIYKLVWMDLLLFLILYYLINAFYFYGLNSTAQKQFETIVTYCSSYGSVIPLSFVLGFYVNMVMQRWWDQYLAIPWPDTIAVYVSAHVLGNDEVGRVMRRTIMRYVCVCFTMVMTMMSPCVKKRFPKLQNLVDVGLLQQNEKDIIEAINLAFPLHPKHWMPIVWATSIVVRARKEGRIRDDYAVKSIIDSLNGFRGYCGLMMYYDFIPVPLVYTQVVTLAVYSFFTCSLLAHQWTIPKSGTYEELSYYVPVFTTLQFFFYMGWLKVAETLINPFGEDDDDFEVNWMVDRHLQVSYMIVDDMHHDHPELVRDQYWDEVFPTELPYENDVKREKPPEHSTAKYDRESSTHQLNVDNSHLIKVESEDSLLSHRSQQFNENFQRYSIHSDDDLSYRFYNTSGVRLSQSTSAESIGAHAMIRRMTSDIINRIFHFKRMPPGIVPPPLENRENAPPPMVTAVPQWREPTSASVDRFLSDQLEEITEELEEGSNYDNEEDEFDHLIESSSTTKRARKTPDLFEQLRLRRLEERAQRFHDYLDQYFGRQYRLAYQDQHPVRARSSSSSTHLTPPVVVELRSAKTSPMASPVNVLTPYSSEIELVKEMLPLGKQTEEDEDHDKGTHEEKNEDKDKDKDEDKGDDQDANENINQDGVMNREKRETDDTPKGDDRASTSKDKGKKKSKDEDGNKSGEQRRSKLKNFIKIGRDKDKAKEKDKDQEKTKRRWRQKSTDNMEPKDTIEEPPDTENPEADNADDHQDENMVDDEGKDPIDGDKK